jgi:hypothetical protein
MDRYTKIILTVIAAALSVIALQNTRIVPAFAAQQSAAPVQVQICGINPSAFGAWNCASMVGDSLQVKAY